MRETEAEAATDCGFAGPDCACDVGIVDVPARQSQAGRSRIPIEGVGPARAEGHDQCPGKDQWQWFEPHPTRWWPQVSFETEPWLLLMRVLTAERV